MALCKEQDKLLKEPANNSNSPYTVAVYLRRRVLPVFNTKQRSLYDYASHVERGQLEAHPILYRALPMSKSITYVNNKGVTTYKASSDKPIGIGDRCLDMFDVMDAFLFCMRRTSGEVVGHVFRSEMERWIQTTHGVRRYVLEQASAIQQGAVTSHATRYMPVAVTSTNRTIDMIMEYLGWKANYVSPAPRPLSMEAQHYSLFLWSFMGLGLYDPYVHLGDMYDRATIDLVDFFDTGVRPTRTSNHNGTWVTDSDKVLKVHCGNYTVSEVLMPDAVRACNHNKDYCAYVALLGEYLDKGRPADFVRRPTNYAKIKPMLVPIEFDDI